MSIWVKRIDVDEDAFEIDLEVATSTSCVKSAICRALRERFHIETSTVTICVANEKKPLVNTKDMVSVSEKEAGHSFILPYLFSIHQNVPAGSFLVVTPNVQRSYFPYVGCVYIRNINVTYCTFL